MLPSAIQIPLVKNRQHPWQRVAGTGPVRLGFVQDPAHRFVNLSFC